MFANISHRKCNFHCKRRTRRNFLNRNARARHPVFFCRPLLPQAPSTSLNTTFLAFSRRGRETFRQQSSLFSLSSVSTPIAAVQCGFENAEALEISYCFCWKMKMQSEKMITEFLSNIVQTKAVGKNLLLKIAWLLFQIPISQTQPS